MVLCSGRALAAWPDQKREPALSQTEIEQLRETAASPSDRLLAFVTFLNERASAIDKLTVGKRHAGREDDIHELLVQFNSISNDLDDNLNDWKRRHRDLRKVLPKLVSACDRWASELRAPADDERYNVARTLALEDLADTKAEAKVLLGEQIEYFKTHKPEDDEHRRPERQ